MLFLRTLLISALLSIVPSACADAMMVPIVFHKKYDISFMGMEKLHPFDTKKYGKVANHLQQTCNIAPECFYQPEKASDADLELVHTSKYLATLKSSRTVATIAEVAPLAFLPNAFLQHSMLASMRYATAGTVLGAQLAMSSGWAINLAGGYHHAKANNGEGFCFFADIPLAIKKLRETNSDLKVLIVDLDAHQGNGLAAILGEDKLTYIFDMYSGNNYPRDRAMYKYIDFNFPLVDYIKDLAYLNLLKSELPKAIEAVKPDLIIYNAGTDIFERDPLGKMKVTKQGIIERDAFVFGQALAIKTPILMVLSGGYSKESADIVGTSIENILKQFKLVEAHLRAAPRRQTLTTVKSKIKKLWTK